MATCCHPHVLIHALPSLGPFMSQGSSGSPNPFHFLKLDLGSENLTLLYAPLLERLRIIALDHRESTTQVIVESEHSSQNQRAPFSGVNVPISTGRIREKSSQFQVSFSMRPREGLLLPCISLTPTPVSRLGMKPGLHPHPCSCSHPSLAAALWTSPCLPLVCVVQMPLTSS